MAEYKIFFKKSVEKDFKIIPKKDLKNAIAFYIPYKMMN